MNDPHALLGVAKPLDLERFEAVTSCIINALKNVDAARDGFERPSYDADDFWRDSLNCGSWLGWASLRAMEWLRHDSRDVFDRCEIVINFFSRYCRAELERAMLRRYRKKSPRKPKKPRALAVLP